MRKIPIAIAAIILCALSFFAGKYSERRLLNGILESAFAFHKNDYAEKYPLVEKVGVEGGEYLSVNLLVRNGGGRFEERQSFDPFGGWQGSEIVEEK